MTNSSRKEIDIEIKDILWETVRRWRVIVLLVIIGAIFMGGRQYISDYKTANTPKEQIVQQALEEANVELNKTEMETVITAVALSAQIDATCTYMNESILMNMDPYHEYAVTLHYVVEGDRAATIAQSYRDYIQSGAFGELVSLVGTAESQDTDGFSVKIIVPANDTDVVGVDAVKEYLTMFSQQLNNTGNTHVLNCVLEQGSEVADLELANLQEEKALALKEDMTTLSNMKANMSADQLRVFLDLEKEYFPWGEETEADTEATTDTTQEVTQGSVSETVRVSINKTQVLVGAIVGLVLAILYIFLAYLLTGKLRRTREMEHLYQLRVLGTVAPENLGKKVGKIDSLLARWKHCKIRELEPEQEIGLVVTGIVIACKKNSLTQIYLTGSQTGTTFSVACEKIAEELKNSGINAVCGAAIAYDANALFAAVENGAVVLVEEIRKSYYSEILREVKMCEENHVNVLGAVVIGE